MRYVILLALLLALAVPALAGNATLSSLEWPDVDPTPLSARAIVDSFDSPNINPMGVEWWPVTQTIYHADELPGTIWEVTPEGGATLLADLAAILGSSADANDLCLFEDIRQPLLFITDWHGAMDNDDPIYVMTLAGALLDSFDVRPFCPGVLGITHDGIHFWLSSYDTGDIIKCDQYFQPLDVYAHPAGYATGGAMDFDPVTGFLYVQDYVTGICYVCDLEMHVIDAFPTCWFGTSTIGITIGRLSPRSERNLWVSCFGTGRIYEIEDLYFSPVQDRSWGAVKAMFR